MTLSGSRTTIDIGDERYPEPLRHVAEPPKTLYLVGDVESLVPGLAVVGARKATPYGIGCARRFSRIAAEKGIVIISGGARGCDSEAHRAALAAGSPTIVVLGGGCDEIYPREHERLFQEVVNAGGLVISEHPWGFPPMPYAFRARNRIIAALAAAVLIVEAGLPSGTFSTADAALELGKEVLVVPGSITSATSRGSNRLLLQGASPIVDDESFEDALFKTLGLLKRPGEAEIESGMEDELVEAVISEPLTDEQVLALARRLFGEDRARSEMAIRLATAEANHLISRYPNGTWGPAVPG